MTSGFRIVASIDAPALPFPAGKRPMAGRKAVPIPPSPEEPARLRWDSGSILRGIPRTLRVTASVDERVPHQVHVTNACTGETYGHIEVLYACPGQVFELPLSAFQADAALRDGLCLSVQKDASPLWIVAKGPQAPASVLPHLAADNAPATLENFLNLFCSEASLQPCDWMEVCVLDGLQDWARRGRPDARTALLKHLEVFFHPETGQRENLFGQPCDQEPGGPETTGPYAILANVDPRHPALGLADEGFEKHRHPGFGTIGQRTIVTESNYNIAYPMMVMALKTGRPHLRERALLQLETARQRLVGEDDLCLRYHFDAGEKTFRNWSRGVAWYFLGLVRTLALLPPGERPEPLAGEIGRAAAWVIRHQLPNGLWPCFLKENTIPPDSSGSAGIAAALALGVRHGLIDPSFRIAALKTRNALMDFMTHDGWLRGTSQSNKRETLSMDIQRARFRVIAPWGMGLFAQLAAALEP
jgi:hypothetical protein